MCIQMYFIIASSLNFAVFTDQAISSGSAGLQHKLGELAQSVIGPLKSGLQSFNSISEMLLSVESDYLLPEFQSFHEIRQKIENMKQEFEKSEQVAMTTLQQLDGDTQRLTAEQSNLEIQKRLKEAEVERLKTELNSHNSLLSMNHDALKRYRRNLRSAEDTLASMKRKRDKAETVRDIGIGLLFIPFVGPIVGSVMIGVAEGDISRASDAIDNARREVWDCESRISSYSASVSGYESKIRQTEHEIRQADTNIGATVVQLRYLSEKRVVVADVQAKTRGAVRQLGEVSAVGSVAELQTRRLILVESMVKVMEEMTSALGHITGDELLHTEGVTSLIGEMKKNRMKLLEKPMSKEHSEL